MRETKEHTREFSERLQTLRKLDNVTNLWCILREYLTLAGVIALAVVSCEAWLQGVWSLFIAGPLLLVSMFVIGTCQHRLGGLGHEGSHFILFKNRVWNELASDLFCMFPVLMTTGFYRQVHLGHHAHANDWERDPELINLGNTRRMAEFPMAWEEFVRSFVLPPLAPASFVAYLHDNLCVNMIGIARHPYMMPEDATKSGRFAAIRPCTVLGIGYLILVAAVMYAVTWYATLTAVIAVPLVMWAMASVVVYHLPERWIFRSQLKSPISTRLTSVLRLGWFTVVFMGFGILENVSGRPWAGYFWLLWILPLATVLPYLALLRDILQHANCDDGRLTNARNIYVNPLIRWAVFIYGQDLHQTHHLYPTVPHYRLLKTEKFLQNSDPKYAAAVLECRGLVRRQVPQRPAVKETLTQEWNFGSTTDPRNNEDPKRIPATSEN